MGLNVLAFPMPAQRQQSLQYSKQRAIDVSIDHGRSIRKLEAINCRLKVLRLWVEMIRRGRALVVIFLEGTHTWNSLHDELSPLAHRPTRKEKIEKNAVIVEELKSIVEDGPFQLCSKTWRGRRRDGGGIATK